MPEFILDTGDKASTAKFKALDSFTQGYVEAMFFTSTGTGDDAENGLEDAHVGELAPEAWVEIEIVCRTFQEAAAPLLAEAYIRESREWVPYDAAAAGRDFWYTRNGHGVGFWDRDALKIDGLGDQLSALCGWRTAFPECSIYRGDDGMIYLQPG